MTTLTNTQLITSNLHTSSILFRSDDDSALTPIAKINHVYYNDYSYSANSDRLFDDNNRDYDYVTNFTLLVNAEKIKNYQEILKTATKLPNTDDIDNNEYQKLSKILFIDRVNNNLHAFPSSRLRTLYTKANQNELLLSSNKIDINKRDIFTSILNGENIILAVPESKFNDYRTVFKAGINISEYFRRHNNLRKLYFQIADFKDNQTRLLSIADLLFKLNTDNQKQILTGLANSSISNVTQIKNLLNKILTLSNIKGDRNLISQEEQIESFLDLSKNQVRDKTEYVSDDLIEKIKNSDAYQMSLQKLAKAGFGISKTQQFNVLQSCGYFGRSVNVDEIFDKNPNFLYNLSDMGAGKTLMTVQAIYVLDLARYIDAKKTKLKGIKNIFLPAKNIIAPKLSMKSSWIDTFKIFYDVEKLNDHHYKLSTKYQNDTIASDLYLSSFTAQTNAIKVDHKLPYLNNKSYLIIDEIHQLAERKLKQTKFFDKNTQVNNNYQTFILSGTLSDLTTDKWLNLINLLSLNVLDNSQHNLKELSPQDASNKMDKNYSNIKDAIAESAKNIESSQRRYFDPEAFDQSQLPVHEEKMTRKDEYFHTIYSPAILSIRNTNTDIRDNLSNYEFTIAYDFNLLSTPNFRLFYDLVGSSAITAQSQTVAKELFGKIKKQHKSEIIKAKSNLTDNDIKILKELHTLTLDYQVYKSAAIANKINNAILNLNDGLSHQSIYDVVNNAAKTNLRFLKYLATRKLDLLTALPKSNLINQPKLEDTAKFKILKNLIKQGKNNTFLVVVNDFDAMKKLSKALNLDCFTKKQIKDQLNYQQYLDEMFEKQNIVIVPQKMIKSSLDLVQANRLIQYQLNNDIADIIQTQNRINRIGQKRETRSYYIATDQLQENIIELFLETYRNIRVAHKGIVELFVDVTSQVNVINDYISKAIDKLNNYQEPVEINNEILLFDPKPYESNIENTDKPSDKSDEDLTDTLNLSRISSPGELPLFNPVETTLMNGLQLV